MIPWTDMVALVAYAVALVQAPRQTRAVLLIALAAVVFHALGLAVANTTDGQWRLGVGAALSLFLWQCVVLHAVSLLRWPLWHLARPVWLMGAAGIAFNWVMPEGTPAAISLGAALRIHIALSLSAWALLTLAALQLAAFAMQDARLRRHGPTTEPAALPLQTMEQLAFGLIAAGFATLSLSIASGFLFVDNFLAQHLVHKTVLALIATGVFGALLVGRSLRGWRGRTAVRWALAGYASLVLAYFGSKFVLEQLLGRTWS